MKRDVKNFALGFVMACLMITPVVAFADAIQVSLNTVNINLNGTQVASKGQSYTLANGIAVPYSLNYNGTVYLPIRKVAELVGKEIGYDGQSSTISISEKKTETEVPVATPPAVTVPDTVTKPAIVEEQGIEQNPTDDSSNTNNNAKEESGFAVINNFPKLLNSSGTQVNRLVGYIDGDQCDMLTSQNDMISYQKVMLALYKITYKNNVITDIDQVSTAKEDTVKTDSEAQIIGNNGTYTLDSNVICYRIVKDGNEYDSYRLSNVSALNIGYKVYLFNTNGSGGYDVVIYETK